MKSTEQETPSVKVLKNWLGGCHGWDDADGAERIEGIPDEVFVEAFMVAFPEDRPGCDGKSYNDTFLRDADGNYFPYGLDGDDRGRIDWAVKKGLRARGLDHLIAWWDR